MKTNMYIKLLALATLLRIAGFAQTYPRGNPNIGPTYTQTTLSGAVTATQQTITLASTTGLVARTYLIQVEDEIFYPVSVDPIGTTATVILRVQRGYNGSRALAHGDGSVVYYGPAANFNACGGQPLATFPCGILANHGATTHFSSNLWFDRLAPLALATAANVTYTPGQILTGFILRDPASSARTDVFPTAALMVAAVPGATTNTAFRIVIRNTSGGANTITMSAGTGGTVSGTATIAQNAQKEFIIVLTAVASGAEAYTAYSMGSTTF